MFGVLLVTSALIAVAQAAPIMGNMHMRLQTLSDVDYTALFDMAVAGKKPAANVGTSVLCFFEKCPELTMKCGLDKGCRAAMECTQKCGALADQKKAPGCAYLCEMTAGYKQQIFEEFLLCANANACISSYPPDGTCLATDADAVQDIKTMEDVKGDWWVIKGINCGQEGTTNLTDFPGGYDWYPCQHERFLLRGEQWINNITYCGGANNTCTSQIIDTVANVTISSPGVVMHNYTDAPLLPQLEHWRIVSRPRSDYVFVVWCGQTPLLYYNGGIVLSSSARSLKDIPPEVEADFVKTAARFGMDWNKMCASDNNFGPTTGGMCP